LRDAISSRPEGTPLKLTLDGGKVLEMRLRDMAPH